MMHVNYEEIIYVYDSEECQKEEEVIKDLILNIPNGIRQKRIIDVGCGDGLLLKLLNTAIEKYMYIGIDPCNAMITRAIERYPENMFIKTGAEILIQEIATKHDIVISLFSIPYFGADTIDDIFNVLKTGGYFFTVYYAKPYLNPASVYAKREQHYDSFVLPQVRACIKKAKKMFSTVYEEPLTPSGAYYAALFRKESLMTK